jgi:hypothetical protein
MAMPTDAETTAAANRATWCAALRSGKYKQGCGALADTRLGDGATIHCCLGVAQEIFGLQQTKNGAELIDDNECQATLGLDVMGQRDLSALNDDGKSFDQIADIIERQYALPSN